jgi:hypothetical protein
MSLRAAGAVAVTVPACWYLVSNAPDTSHGHDDHGDPHGAAHGKKHEDEPKEEDGEGEKSEDTEGEEEESQKSEDSDDEDNGEDTPDTSEDEGVDDGKNTKTANPDAKGGIKKRSESKKAIKAGESDDEV